MTAHRPEGTELPEVDAELVPDLTTELADAAAAQDAADNTGEVPVDADGMVPPARRFAVYDTRLERYVTGVVSEAAARGHGVSKTGRFQLHELDTEGRLVRATFP